MELLRFLEEFSTNIECLYSVGDMNIDLLKHDSLTEQYRNRLINYAVEHVIAEATRIGEGASLLIDHIICKRIMFLNSEVIPKQ